MIQLSDRGFIMTGLGFAGFHTKLWSKIKVGKVGGGILKTRARKCFVLAIYCLSVASLFQLPLLSGQLCLAEDEKVSSGKYKPDSESPASLKGKQIFQEHQCASCHSSGTSGGCLGPPLLGVGARRSREFITARITDDKVEIA